MSVVDEGRDRARCTLGRHSSAPFTPGLASSTSPLPDASSAVVAYGVAQRSPGCGTSEARGYMRTASRTPLHSECAGDAMKASARGTRFASCSGERRSWLSPMGISISAGAEQGDIVGQATRRKEELGIAWLSAVTALNAIGGGWDGARGAPAPPPAGVAG